MVINNVVEICVAICIAILGIAYPIIVNNISSIGEKYSSIHIQKLFHSEFPQNRLVCIERKFRIKVSWFNFFLYCTLVSFIPLIFPRPPIKKFNIHILDFLLNNSADFIVIFMTILLCFLFFRLLNNVYLYSGNTNDFLQYLILKFSRTKITDSENYNLKAINEIAIYALKKDDPHLYNTLFNFYVTYLNNIHNVHEQQSEIIYPENIYQIFLKINQIVANNERRA